MLRFFDVFHFLLQISIVYRNLAVIRSRTGVPRSDCDSIVFRDFSLALLRSWVVNLCAVLRPRKGMHWGSGLWGWADACYCYLWAIARMYRGCQRSAPKCRSGTAASNFRGSNFFKSIQIIVLLADISWSFDKKVGLLAHFATSSL